MKLVAIVNPNAGKKKGAVMAEYAASLMKKEGISLEFTFSRSPRHCQELARDLNLSDWDGIIAVGGDGTLSEVVTGLMENKQEVQIPLGLIPIGTGNSFIQDLGISTVEEAVRNIVENRRIRIDVGEMTCGGKRSWFINMLGNGYAADVLREAIRFKKTGPLAYTLGVFSSLVNLKAVPTRLNIDGKEYKRDTIFTMICNSKITGGNMLMAPDADITDGLFDVVIINKMTRRRLISLLPTLFKGDHINAPETEVLRGKQIIVETDPETVLNVDGELFGTTPLSVTMLPGQIEFFGSLGK